MTHSTLHTQDVETSSPIAATRLTELTAQGWERIQSVQLAEDEGLRLDDRHWAVIEFLRAYYLENGLPRCARTTAEALNLQFAEQGGSRYLRGLFAGGPVTQGSRIANLCAPANASDLSFGTSY